MKKQYIYSILITLCLTTMALGRAPESADIDRLITPYLEIQTALAGDDLPATNTAGGHLSSALSTLHSEGVHLHELMAASKSIAIAKDIKSARGAFLPLSNAIAKLVKQHGVAAGRELFVAHCSMAFDGKGGDWVQSDKHVLNPYWGARMLHCGGITEQIAGKDAKASTQQEHGGDDHAHHGH